MNVKKVVLVDAITQKKIANVETARQEIVIAISMRHNILIKKEIWYFTKSLFLLTQNYLSVIRRLRTPVRTRRITLHLIVLEKISLSLLTNPTAAAATAID